MITVLNPRIVFTPSRFASHRYERILPSGRALHPMRIPSAYAARRLRQREEVPTEFAVEVIETETYAPNWSLFATIAILLALVAWACRAVHLV